MNAVLRKETPNMKYREEIMRNEERYQKCAVYRGCFEAKSEVNVIMGIVMYVELSEESGI